MTSKFTLDLKDIRDSSLQGLANKARRRSVQLDIFRRGEASVVANKVEASPQVVGLTQTPTKIVEKPIKSKNSSVKDVKNIRRQSRLIENFLISNINKTGMSSEDLPKHIDINNKNISFKSLETFEKISKNRRNSSKYFLHIKFLRIYNK